MIYVLIAIIAVLSVILLRKPLIEIAKFVYKIIIALFIATCEFLLTFLHAAGLCNRVHIERAFGDAAIKIDRAVQAIKSA